MRAAVSKSTSPLSSSCLSMQPVGFAPREKPSLNFSSAASAELCFPYRLSSVVVPACLGPSWAPEELGPEEELAERPPGPGGRRGQGCPAPGLLHSPRTRCVGSIN